MSSPPKQLSPHPKLDTLTLRVSEALTKDVGHGIARLDPADMEKLACQVGDTIYIEGKRTTIAKVAPTYQENRGEKCIQMDGILRENAKVGLDEKVHIRTTTVVPARSLRLKTTLGALRQSSLPSADRYMGRLLEGLPVIKGDKIRALLFGSRTRDFEVVDTLPEGAVLIASTTQINIEGEEHKGGEKQPTAVSYEDVGGLGKEIQRIREMVELPLKYPEVFDRLGIDPPKGVLLYGPPGTGKTLIARAVAHESEANFFSVNGPEIVHKFYGESEAHLRSIFERASQSPASILFIDEIDAIAPKRANVQGEVEKRIVATLLSLMDGLKSRGQLIVIGATNMPDLLDPALRRPGRFDREIQIGIPDRNGRLNILEIHTRGMPLAKDVSIAKLAEITHGYVGADLEALAREAAMSCLRSLFQEKDISLEEIPDEVIQSLEVRMDHFLEALREVEPSAIREVSIEIPDVRWEDVGGLDAVKETLRETIEWPLKYDRLFEIARLRPIKGILLHGPPGTGKTLLARALATESGVNFVSVKGPALLSKWVGESEKALREIFKKAKAAAPCILFFDEIDSLAPHRHGGGSDSGVMERLMSQFLAEFDGIEELKGVLVLAATNRKDLIDPALLRPGRFDLLIELPLPDLKARQAIFEIHTKGKPLDKGVDLEALAQVTQGWNGSEIEGICRQAAVNALRSFIVGDEKEGMGKVAGFKISMKDFQNAVAASKEGPGK
ncbi:MAG: CDC48 family AAA ATPase [Candidatus Eisenbacteria bacterium]|nr:CDC48 family AAA ATPase [Candidatus Eisenbacteria bacterium]